MKNILNGFKTAFYLLCIIWAIYFIDLILLIDLRNFGIVPRTTNGLIGIAFAPFLHANLAHLIANSLALFTLTGIVFSYNQYIARRAIVIIIIVGGLGTWIFGSNSVHMGASGLIFGLIGFLLFIGIYRRDIKAIIISIIVGFFYGSALLGLLIIEQGISWSGHLFGFLSGIYAARIFKKLS